MLNLDFELSPVAFFNSFYDFEYFVDFLLPVGCLCLTLLSIMVELQQVINLCLDFSDEDDEFNNQATRVLVESKIRGTTNF